MSIMNDNSKTELPGNTEKICRRNIPTIENSTYTPLKKINQIIW